MTGKQWYTSTKLQHCNNMASNKYLLSKNWIIFYWESQRSTKKSSSMAARIKSRIRRKRGVTNFSKTELSTLLNLIEEHILCGAFQWDVVSSAISWDNNESNFMLYQIGHKYPLLQKQKSLTLIPLYLYLCLRRASLIDNKVELNHHWYQ